MNSPKIAILGAGGHATVVASTAMAMGYTVTGFYADDPAKLGERILGAEVKGSIDDLTMNDCTHVILGIGDNLARKRIVESKDFNWISLVHPFSCVHESVPVGEGTLVCAGTVIQPEAKIGRHAIVNTSSNVEHHCSIGDYTHLASAHLAGACNVEEGGFLGARCIILPKLTVGAWATVGAGAVVTKPVVSGDVVVGVPARPMEKKALSRVRLAHEFSPLVGA